MVTEKVTGKVTYLGDGLYAVFNGYQIELRANYHEHPTDTVYLDSHTLDNFLKYVESLKVKNNE